MNKLVAVVALSASFLVLSGCSVYSVDSVRYDPGYSADYVYSVNYYNNRPYWGNNYLYPAYRYRDGYWGGYGYYNAYYDRGFRPGFYR